MPISTRDSQIRLFKNEKVLLLWKDTNTHFLVCFCLSEIKRICKKTALFLFYGSIKCGVLSMSVRVRTDILILIWRLKLTAEFPEHLCSVTYNVRVVARARGGLNYLNFTAHNPHRLRSPSLLVRARLTNQLESLLDGLDRDVMTPRGALVKPVGWKETARLPIRGRGEPPVRRALLRWNGGVADSPLSRRNWDVCVKLTLRTSKSHLCLCVFINIYPFFPDVIEKLKTASQLI